MLRNLIRRVVGESETEVAGSRRIIVGLGNPGSKYAATRHNIGFQVVDELARRLPVGNERSRFDSQMVEIPSTEYGPVVLVKPLTMMNLSGTAVGQIQRWFKTAPQDVLVIFDDLDLALGRIRLRPTGGAGGHNGVQSLIDHLGTSEFPRLRIGIGRPTHGSTVNYVLSQFRAEEREVADRVVDVAADAALVWLRDGLDNAMNAYNRVDVGNGKGETATRSTSQPIR